MSERDGNPVTYDEDYGWGFWDETWSDWEGGFDTEEEAKAALKEYCIRNGLC